MIGKNHEFEHIMSSLHYIIRQFQSLSADMLRLPRINVLNCRDIFIKILTFLISIGIAETQVLN